MDPWGTIDRLNRQEIKALQNRKLHYFINRHLYPFSPHYQKLFDSQHIDPKSIRTIEDLKKIPFSSKADFISTEQSPEKFKEFILQPDQAKIRRHWPASKLLVLAVLKVVKGQEYVMDQLRKEYRPVFITFTTGTTSKPISYLYSDHDVKNLYTSGARMLKLFDVEASDNIVNMFPFAPHLAFWQVVFGGLEAGNLVLGTGGGKVMGTEGNISALLKMKPSVIIGVPSYVYHVVRTASEKNCRMDFVKKIVLGADAVPETYKLRLAGLLESMGAKDVKIFGTYGFTEARSAWGECPTKLGVSSGYHLYPDKEIFEIIDPGSGEVKKEGEDGELVYTSLDSRASSVIRYRTGDFIKGGITYEPCPYCGRTLGRISSRISRISDTKGLQLSKIKGSLVNLSNFATALMEIGSINEWQLEIRKKDNDPYGVDEVIVYVCPRGNADRQKLEEEIKKKILLTTEVSPNEVIFLPFDDIVKKLELETANKEKRIVDSRPK